MIVLIDNYDSFTYNLVQRIGELNLGVEMRVYRNDQITTDQIDAEKPSHIIISPGPCTPREGGVSNDVIRRFSGRVPLLGVCLGHQCIAYAHGAEVVRAQRLMHGKTSMIRHDGAGIFRGLENPFEATRYHSLIVANGTLPQEFVVTATCEDDPTEIMALRHRTHPTYGVQFHPESFLTREGSKLLANFIRFG
ncbi:MAG: aminodeoxychorismate/anthranilate synthase component II [Phycisphaerales bacterium]|nr:aminodeoxychorismate/anthranilate synthase component II [Phycisphaerales bacterium]